MQATTIDVSGIFNRSRILTIPHFQRAFVWKVDDWERFLDDMIYVAKKNAPYFMGSIILKQKETSSGDQTGDIRIVIDGQQRLTTILLFFKALYSINGIPEQFSTTFKPHKGELIIDHNYKDKPVFDKIILNKEILEPDRNTNIWKCYDYFLTKIKKNEIDPAHILGRVQFVSIDVSQNEDEQQIFDTINSLGVPLTTAELLKNFLFKNDIASYNANWRDVFEKNDEDIAYWDTDVSAGRHYRKNIDLFLQSFLFIKMQDRGINVSTDDIDQFFKIDSVFKSYKQLIHGYDLNPMDIIREIKEYSIIYKKNIIPTILEDDIEKDDYVQRLNLVIFGLNTTTIIPYVLFVAKRVRDDSEKSRMFRYLETYLIRRLICRSTAKNYNKFFQRSLILNEIDTLQKLREIVENKSENSIDYMPGDNTVREKFNDPWYSNVQPRVILYLIERTVRDELDATELKTMSDYTLEHVMPQEWTTYWDKDKVFTDQQRQERNDLVRNLGNLTIITKGLNSSISNSDWKKKKIGSGKHKGLLEHSQGISIFSKYMLMDTWDETVIIERAEELCRYSVDNVWSLNIE